MNKQHTYDIIIIGGGLAGLTTALHLGKSNVNILLIEKQKFPHHKVCGEYVSNEVLPYLHSLGIDPLQHGAKEISRFEISNQKGTLITTELPLGGFGMSRYALDHLLYKQLSEDVTVIFDTAEHIKFEKQSATSQSEIFQVQTQRSGTYHGKFVVGAFGKRSNLDISMQRKFISEKSQWLAVKAHYQGNIPDDMVALHNFEGGYCGLSKTETDAVNVCYLTTLASFKKAGSIQEFQQYIMTKNPFLAKFFNASKLIFEKPLTISQIAFAKKDPVEQHVFMLGDSAGLIHPLCGNGMAMAIHSAKLFSELYLTHSFEETMNRKAFEQAYAQQWHTIFAKRLKRGRQIQKLLLNPQMASIGFSIGKAFPSLVQKLIQQTHGTTL